jgi:hypothetical protein
MSVEKSPAVSRKPIFSSKADSEKTAATVIPEHRMKSTTKTTVIRARMLSWGRSRRACWALCAVPSSRLSASPI